MRLAIRHSEYIRGTNVTNAFDTWEPPDHSRGGAAKMTNEQIDALRTGERPNAYDIEDFHHLPAPVIVCRRPATGRFSPPLL